MANPNSNNGGEARPLSARVPDRVARGAFSTAVVVLDGPNEFVIDFLQSMTRPRNVVARVVVTPAVMEQIVAAMRENLNKYEQSYGPPPPLPRPNPEHRPTIQEIYDEFKVSDDLLSGSYANAVMIGHSPAEFFLDFITSFYPTAAVSSRVLITAAQAPRMLETFAMSLQQYRRRQTGTTTSPPPKPADPAA